MPQEARQAPPLPTPAPLDEWQRSRRLGLAEWHLNEAVLLEAAGDEDEARGHLTDAREFLEIARGARLESRELTADRLRFELQKELDR